MTVVIDDPAWPPDGGLRRTAALQYCGDIGEGIEGLDPSNLVVSPVDVGSSSLSLGWHPVRYHRGSELWTRWSVLDQEGVSLRDRLLGRVARLHGPCLLRAFVASPDTLGPRTIWPGVNCTPTELYIYSRIAPEDGGSKLRPLLTAFSPHRQRAIGPSVNQWCPSWNEALRLPYGIAQELRRERAHDGLYLIETADYDYPSPRPAEPGHVRPW